MKILRTKVPYMKKLILLTAAALLMLTSACTSIQTTPLPYDPAIGTVKIIRNPKVKVSDFLSVMRRHFSLHGIPTALVGEEYEAKDGEYTVQYTALRSWDFAPYLSSADVDVYKAGYIVGTAHFHLIGKGGFSFYKWDKTDTKLTPMYEELLKNYPGTKQEREMITEK